VCSELMLSLDTKIRNTWCSNVVGTLDFFFFIIYYISFVMIGTKNTKQKEKLAKKNPMFYKDSMFYGAKNSCMLSSLGFSRVVLMSFVFDDAIKRAARDKSLRYLDIVKRRTRTRGKLVER
jgi:hypothetical protein